MAGRPFHLSIYIYNDILFYLPVSYEIRSTEIKETSSLLLKFSI